MTYQSKQERGFTLVELLVSVLIFTFVVLGVYTLFDQGAWVYLHSSRRANIQQIARLALEQIERDVRMSGFGVPSGDEFGAGTAMWTPNMFTLGPGRIFFRADIDNRHTWVRQNITGTPTTISVEDPQLVCPVPGTTQIVLVENGDDWQPLTCTAFDDTTDTITTNTGAMDCPSEECEIFTPEHIFYRLTGDANNDGICDNTAPNDAPFCTIERAVIVGNDPIAGMALPGDDEFQELASNIISFSVQQPGLLQIQLTVRDRSMEGPQKYQDVVLTTQILVRGNEY
jgi:prepilin-type N-terminal cleavage/methylation domain-containing protein